MNNSKNQYKKSVIIIGGGLGGLAAACTLAGRGFKVTLLEKNSWLGGKAAEIRSQSFRFDMGPTILTVPAVLRRIFAEAGKQLEEELQLIRLDPQWRCFFADHSVLDLQEDPAIMAENIRRFSPHTESNTGYQDFLRLSERLHTISNRFFFWKSVEGIKDTLEWQGFLNLSTLQDILSIRMGQSVAGVIRRRVKDPRVAQMLDHFTQYVGSSPYLSPAVLCSIAHMQTDGGVWYPRGGTRAIPECLTHLATNLGVDIQTNCLIEKILIENRRVTGVKTSAGDILTCDAVISNMDSIRTYRELIGKTQLKTRFEKNVFRPACSGVVLYLGLNKAYEHLLHHNFIFSADPKSEFDWIYHKNQPAPDPSCYIAAPARTDPGVAPPGGEALYVLVHTPYLQPDHNWQAMLPGYRQVILNKLKQTAGMGDIEDRIIFEEVLTPQDIHERYRVLNGAIYGLASHGRFTGAFKPGNRSREVSGLYLAGGAAHPGPGMPMALMSGWIAADALDQDQRH